MKKNKIVITLAFVLLIIIILLIVIFWEILLLEVILDGVNNIVETDITKEAVSTIETEDVLKSKEAQKLLAEAIIKEIEEQENRINSFRWFSYGLFLWFLILKTIEMITNNW